MQTTIAEDSACPVAPNNFVTDKAADPDTETNHILNGEQPPLLLGDRIVNNVTSGRKSGAASQNQREQDRRPRSGVGGPQQERQRQRIGEDLAPITYGA